MSKKVSLKDIAEKVGVSVALVSYVLNNQKEDRISKAVAQKIRDTAKEMNYRTNQIAKSLKTSKTHTIGLIVSDIANPFSSSLARIIEDEADRNNYTVIFGSSDENPQKSWTLIETLLNRQVDGLIIATAVQTESQIQYLQQQDVPFVLVDRYFPGLETSYVVLDNRHAAFMATSHLIGCGYKNIGLITYDTSLFHMQERTQGYTDALEQYGITVKEQLIQKAKIEDLTPTVEKAVDILLGMEEPTDAILFTTNLIALQAVKYINAKRIRIPEELALACFDEVDAMDLFYAPLTYLKQPLQQMGRSATQILLKSMDGDKSVTQLKMEAELIIRASTRKV
ncbi:MAG: substrate-binding domain-containing protein [Chitinophagaceae bacterium]